MTVRTKSKHKTCVYLLQQTKNQGSAIGGWNIGFWKAEQLTNLHILGHIHQVQQQVVSDLLEWVGRCFRLLQIALDRFESLTMVLLRSKEVWKYGRTSCRRISEGLGPSITQLVGSSKEHHIKGWFPSELGCKEFCIITGNISHLWRRPRGLQGNLAQVACLTRRNEGFMPDLEGETL